ncbi:NADP-dependent glyceraldehyde-3-phosphate dehydrogenase [Bradyrhizobium jicamae]|uniref:NADP-dependent glyceraldehyde-3-phosphate dehydrogenase n=1 Tax=Bradyrhizobium jicamae TaxID=280332 RepID=UPI002897A619|nr:NADP-dependent glyceraldehyde-3-phosphate dehydrogenase [Bradyrhizobium jicamae]
MVDSLTLEQLFVSLSDIPSRHRLAEPIHQRSILLDGALQPWNGANQPVLSPIWTRNHEGLLGPTEIGSYPKGSSEATEAALTAAVRAYANGSGEWPTMTVAERIACMERFTRQMLARRNEIVSLIMWEVGKTFPDSEKEFDRTIVYIAATIDALKDLDNSSSRFVVAEGTIGQIRRTPLGVVLCMGPYNYPLNETFATLIPALIMGNTILLKPPRFGVLLFQPLLEAFSNSFPKGVVNTVYGNGADVVPALLGSGKVNVLTLIGSSKVADHLKKLHPKVNRLRAILGLDAKNAAIVMPDADLELAVRECLLGALSFNGQRCTALKALLVHSAIVDQFTHRLGEEIAKLKVGMPWDAGVTITPLAEPGKAAYLAECIRDAEAKGARVVNPGGGSVCQSLFYPALVCPVSAGMKLYREEQFGPVIPVIPFDRIEVALDYVAAAENGQQVSIFSANPELIGRLVDPLVNQVCRVNINCQCQRGPDVFPFTGRKDSAEGTLSVSDALRSFSIRSMIATKQTDANKQLLGTIVKEHRSNFINTGFIL